MTINQMFTSSVLTKYTGIPYLVYAEKKVGDKLYTKTLGPYTQNVVYAVVDEYMSVYHSDSVTLLHAETGEVLEVFTD